MWECVCICVEILNRVTSQNYRSIICHDNVDKSSESSRKLNTRLNLEFYTQSDFDNTDRQQKFCTRVFLNWNIIDI